MTNWRSALIEGERDDGSLKAIKSTAEGHLEVAIHAPRLPFGSIHTESMTPIFQTDFVYGINPAEVITTTGINVAGTSSASNAVSNNIGTCSTGTTAYSFASMQSRKRLRYRPGQGVISRFTALFSQPAESSILVAGVGTGESGLFFGYNGTSFGILHSTGGVREIQTLTITTASTATNDYNVQLNGTTFNVTATNNGSTAATAYEISQGSYTGWEAEAIGSTVVFLADAVGDKTGSFSLGQSGAGTPAAGTFAETLAGVASTDTWIPQSSWNGDKLDGTGASGVTLNPQNGNVYQIDIQYLGFGGITFKVEVNPDGNNPDFVSVHTLDIPNQQTSVSVSQPSFPFTMSAYSAGSTTDVSVSCASFSGFVEGKKQLTGPRMCFVKTTNNYITTTLKPIFTIRNDLAHQHGAVTKRANQSIVNLISIACAHDDATPIDFYLIRNATLTGTPSFSRYSTSSCIYYDDSATGMSYSNNEQIVFVYTLPQNSGGVYGFADDTEITIQPGETITLAAVAVTGTATYVNASLNTREDQ